MDTFDGKYDGNLCLSDDLDLCGLINGSVTVPEGRRLLLHGMITGDLVVEANARAEIYGTVGGAVLNRGADVEIFGMVGSVRDVSTRRTRVDSQAIVREAD